MIAATIFSPLTVLLILFMFAEASFKQHRRVTASRLLARHSYFSTYEKSASIPALFFEYQDIEREDDEETRANEHQLLRLKFEKLSTKDIKYLLGLSDETYSLDKLTRHALALELADRELLGSPDDEK